MHLMNLVYYVSLIVGVAALIAGGVVMVISNLHHRRVAANDGMSVDIERRRETKR